MHSADAAVLKKYAQAHSADPPAYSRRFHAKIAKNATIRNPLQAFAFFAYLA